MIREILGWLPLGLAGACVIGAGCAYHYSAFWVSVGFCVIGLLACLWNFLNLGEEIYNRVERGL